MKTRPALFLVLLAVAVIGLALPALAASVDCEEDGGADCCGLDCALCVCCAHTPQTALCELDRGIGSALDGRLRRVESARPREPDPRAVLHVPRSTPVA